MARPHDLPSGESYVHGTRARYISGCRCLICRAAASRYETERLAARKRGEWNGLVSTDRARAHMLALSRQGVGRRAVGAASDVGDTTLQEIRSGKKTQIRALTERRKGDGLQFGRVRMTARNVRRVDRLYHELLAI